MTTNTLPKTDIAPSSAAPTSRSITRVIARHLPTVARVLLGLVFFVFGLNGFLNFIPPPTDPMPEGAVKLGTALMESGYLMQLVKGTEVLVGLCLLTNRFVPLALVVLAPVLVNILAFHAFLLPGSSGLPLVLAALTLYLAWTHRRAYAPLLTARAR